MFDAAPKGSRIMITIFSWADQPPADADKDRRTRKVKKVALGDTTMYLYPQRSHTPDLELDLVKATSCRGTKKTIRVAQYTWTQ